MPKTVKRHEVKILLIEDNTGDARLIEQRLRWESIPGIADASSITHVETLKDGFKRLEEEAYDVVLLDLGLPESTGIETLERLLAHISSIPIIVLTGLDDTETAIEAIQKGAQDYFVKDEISSRLLKRAIRYAIERKRTKEKLRESMEKLRAMFESIGDGVILTDLTGTIVEANDAAAHLVGYSDKKELIGQNAFEFVHSEDRELAKETTKKTIEEGQVQEKTEYRILTTDGREIDTDSSAGLLYDDSGNPTGIINVVRDITERKRIEKELMKANEELQREITKRERADEELNTFVYTISHDLKTPLVSLQGFCFLLMKDCEDRLDENGKVYMDRIQKNSEHIGILIENLLELSRLGRTKAQEELANISDVISDVADELAPQLEERGTRLIVKDEMPTVWCDRTSISQVFANLISNANKFMGEDNEDPTIQVGYDGQGSYHTFYVKDNGIGIDEKYHEKIFRIFECLNDIETEGTGMGLALVKKIVESFGGKIWVNSAKGKGTTMYFTMPKTASVCDEEEPKQN